MKNSISFAGTTGVEPETRVSKRTVAIISDNHYLVDYVSSAIGNEYDVSVYYFLPSPTEVVEEIVIGDFVPPHYVAKWGITKSVIGVKYERSENGTKSVSFYRYTVTLHDERIPLPLTDPARHVLPLLKKKGN